MHDGIMDIYSPSEVLDMQIDQTAGRNHVWISQYGVEEPSAKRIHLCLVCGRSIGPLKLFNWILLQLLWKQFLANGAVHGSGMICSGEERQTGFNQ